MKRLHFSRSPFCSEYLACGKFAKNEKLATSDSKLAINSIRIIFKFVNNLPTHLDAMPNFTNSGKPTLGQAVAAVAVQTMKPAIHFDTSTANDSFPSLERH